MADSLNALTVDLRDFAHRRDWDQFHSPKNLAMALSVEVAELVEPFQWLTEQQSRALDSESKSHVREELADVLLYLIRLADQLDIDLIEAGRDKLAVNESKYPISASYGSARKMDAR